MYILYLDESGMHAAAEYFVLGGLAVFEREIYWFAKDMDALQARYFPERTDTVEFHASVLGAPEGKVASPFDELSKQQRRELQEDIYKIIRERRGVLFGVAIEKAWCKNEDPYEKAFEDLTSRFDLFVQRANHKLPTGSEEQRGLIAVAESNYRNNIEVLGERFRGGSTRWGGLHAIADVPFFLPAKNTRLLQFADFCANAIYRRYNSGITRDFDTIAPKFDREDNRIHGLAHLCRDHECQCPACLTRQTYLR